LPGFVKRRLEAKIVHAAIDDLKGRIESLAAPPISPITRG